MHATGIAPYRNQLPLYQSLIKSVRCLGDGAVLYGDRFRGYLSVQFCR
ncbi:hypothetical protein AB0758_47040 [Tolypothrix bouteillei VB521301_2]